MVSKQSRRFRRMTQGSLRDRVCRAVPSWEQSNIPKQSSRSQVVQSIVTLIIFLPTMNKKSIAALTGQPSLPADLFATSVQAVKAASKIIPQSEFTAGLRPPKLARHHQLLEAQLKRTLSLFAKVVGVEKNSLAGVVEHTVEVFEAVTDLIETSVKRYREGKRRPEQPEAIPKDIARPFQMYCHFKPAAFRSHEHKNVICRYRYDTTITCSQQLTGSANYVQTQAQFDQMMIELCRENQIAVDVQHSSKSYEGLTCLVQISTRSQDYILDVFPLWSRVTELNSVLSKPSIIKVMHGAEMDVKWLQRDFDIHIVNLFDTHRASRALGLQKLSYAYLLGYYCSTDTDKQYQLADWRIRPLTPEMLHYSRIDTHFLLEIFDRMRADLAAEAIKRKLDPITTIQDVYKASHVVTLIQIELFDFRKKQLYVSLQQDLRPKDFEVMHELFKIIDGVASEENLSFDDLVSKRALTEIVARTKELLLEKNTSNYRLKIERLMNILTTKFNPVKPLIAQLQRFFSNTFSSLKIVKPVASEIIPIFEAEQPFFVRDKNDISFEEFTHKTFEDPLIQPFTLVHFEPMNTFLSKKYGIQMLPEEQEVEELEEQIVDQAEMQEQNVQSAAEEEIIEFKRMNANVIYTVEADPEIVKASKPRKKVKELEYETRLRNKTGNVYELLEE